MGNIHDIILCQPDSSKGCCVCCGLFNYITISEPNLTRILRNAPDSISDSERVDRKPSEHPNTLRDITSHICRYLGFLSTNRPGCTVHPLVLGSDGRDKSLYGARICQDYLCPAHEILSNLHKQVLISSLDSWYDYSIAIIDPESFIWIYDLADMYFPFRTKVSDQTGIRCFIQKAISLHGTYLMKCSTSVFHYSRSEYNQHKSNFGIAYNEEEIREIFAILSGFL